MYEKPERAALIGIAEIRNVFAHKLTISSFEAKDSGSNAALRSCRFIRDTQDILRLFGKEIPSTT